MSERFTAGDWYALEAKVSHEEEIMRNRESVIRDLVQARKANRKMDLWMLDRIDELDFLNRQVTRLGLEDKARAQTLTLCRS